MSSYDMRDHRGLRLAHGRARTNGIQLHYAIGGAGAPVYLVHGAPRTMFIWRHVVPLLTPSHTVVVMDCRGHGDSERPLTGYDTATMADDIIGLADLLGHPTFRIVGEDWGAAIAYAVAASHRDGVVQLVPAHDLVRLPKQALDAAQNREHFVPPLTMPVLAVGGADYLADEPYRHMREVATDVRAAVLENCGHNPSLEAPERLAAEYLHFFTDFFTAPTQGERGTPARREARPCQS